MHRIPATFYKIFEDNLQTFKRIFQVHFHPLVNIIQSILLQEV